jgi:hypothetical protein
MRASLFGGECISVDSDGNYLVKLFLGKDTVLYTKNQLAKELSRDVRCLRVPEHACKVEMGRKLIPLYSLQDTKAKN